MEIKIEISKQLMKLLQKIAKEQNMTKEEFIIKAIENYLNKGENNDE